MKTKTAFLILIVSILLSVACQPETNPTKTDSLKSERIAIAEATDSIDAIVNSILAISANDFSKNQQPLPVDFRDVKIKYSIKPNKEVLYILCGEFTCDPHSNNAGWIHFTTIKNSAYEQWIGANGISYCENATEIAYKKRNLSSELKNKLIELQKEIH